MSDKIQAVATLSLQFGSLNAMRDFLKANEDSIELVAIETESDDDEGVIIDEETGESDENDDEGDAGDEDEWADVRPQWEECGLEPEFNEDGELVTLRDEDGTPYLFDRETFEAVVNDGYLVVDEDQVAADEAA